MLISLIFPLLISIFKEGKMCITADSVNSLSPSFASASQGFSNDNTTVMYYLLVAMMSQLDCCKQCIDKDKDAQIKQAIELQLQRLDSIESKERLLDYLKATMKDADKDLIAWIEGFDNSVHSCQQQIDDSILKYQEALKKLNKKFLREKNYLPKNIRQQFENLQKQIQGLINKSNHSTKDLETLQNNFKQLISIAQKQIENNPLYKAIQWLNEQANKASKDLKSQKGFFNRYLGDFITIGLCKMVGGLLGFFDLLCTNPIYKAEKSFGQKGKAITNVNLSVNNLVNSLVRINLNTVEQILQLNSKAKKGYKDAEKQITNLSEILGQALQNNKV